MPQQRRFGASAVVRGEPRHKVGIPSRTPPSQVPEASQVPASRLSPPSSTFFLDEAAENSTPEVTTLMLRNIPRKYTDEAVTLELQFRVGLGPIDFIYLPWDSARNLNNGHVFVNCVTPIAARALAERLEWQPWECGPSKKRVEVRAATAQGIAANLERYVESMHARPGGSRFAGPGEHGEPKFPLVFHDGHRIPFLQAVEIRCPPHVRASVARRGWDVGSSDCTLGVEREQEWSAPVNQQPRAAQPNATRVAHSGSQPLSSARFATEDRQHGAFAFSRSGVSNWQHMTQPLGDLFEDVSTDACSTDWSLP